MANLPTLDFAKFTHGTEVERQQIGQALTESLLDHGFVKLINHGLPDETIADLFDLVSQVGLILTPCLGNVLINKVAEIFRATIVRQEQDCLRS
jgi:hypothetical protein